jgi:hypothetical protein
MHCGACMTDAQNLLPKVSALHGFHHHGVVTVVIVSIKTRYKTTHTMLKCGDISSSSK